MNENIISSALAPATIREAFERDPKQMTSALARKLGVAEIEVLDALSGGVATRLDAARAADITRSFDALGRVHVVMSNEGATMECVGEFGGFSTWREYFNVRSDSLDMHIRFGTVSAVYALRKPSHMDGVPTLSVQFFTASGVAAFKVFLTFGGDAPSESREAQFQNLIDRFALSEFLPDKPSPCGR